MRTPQDYSTRLNSTNASLERIGDEIMNYIGKDGKAEMINFRENVIPPFVRGKMCGHVSVPDFMVSLSLGGAHSLLTEFAGRRDELSGLINQEMKNDTPDMFVARMIAGMERYRHLYEEKERECLLLPELITYYQTGESPYVSDGDGNVVTRWGGWLGTFRTLYLRCGDFMEIVNYYNGKTGDDNPEGETRSEGCPSELLRLFHGNSGLISELIGKSDNEIAGQICKWAGEKDKLGRPLIENPRNNLKCKFARCLKEAGIIKTTVDTFRRSL